MGTRVTQVGAEVLVEPTSQRARVTQVGAEVLVAPTTQRARVSQVAAEVLLTPDARQARISQFVLEVLVKEAIPSKGDTEAGDAALTDLLLPKPDLTAIGDFMLAQVAFRSSAALTAPDGWTLIREDRHGSGLGQALYYRFATADDAAVTGYTWTLDAAQHAGGGISTYSDIVPWDPFDAHDGVVYDNETNVDAPSVNVSNKGNRVVTLYASGSAASTANQWTPPEGHSEGRDRGVTGGATNDDNLSVMKSHKLHGGGATGLQRAVAASGNPKVAQVVVLREKSFARPRASSVIVM